MDACEVTILDWEKYQGDAKRWKRTDWLRIDNNLFDKNIWDELEGIEFKAYYAIVAWVSQHGHKTGTAVLSFKTMKRKTGLEAGVLLATLKKLASPIVGILTFTPLDTGAGPDEDEVGSTAPNPPGAHSEHAPGESGEGSEPPPSARGECHVLRNVTLRNIAQPSAPSGPPVCADEDKGQGGGKELAVTVTVADFDELYGKYPRKRDRARALQVFMIGNELGHGRIRTKAECQLVAKAIAKLRREISAGKRSLDRVPYFKNFLLDYREWLSQEDLQEGTGPPPVRKEELEAPAVKTREEALEYLARFDGKIENPRIRRILGLEESGPKEEVK